jgi:guanylate kinase
MEQLMNLFKEILNDMGKDAILEIDYKGMLSIKEGTAKCCIYIYITSKY